VLVLAADDGVRPPPLEAISPPAPVRSADPLVAIQTRSDKERSPKPERVKAGSPTSSSSLKTGCGEHGEWCR